MKKLIPSLVFLFVAAAASPVAAQTTSKPAVESAQPATAAQVPLRVQLVVSRYQGEKKVSSTPYTISVIANDNDRTSLRMGVDVPIPQTVTKPGEGPSVFPQSYNYRSVGTNIDCGARTIGDGLFRLELTVSNSSVFMTDKQGEAGASTLPGVPAFRSFASSFNVLLKDGQSAQHTAATDPVTGEVLRVDVTVNVLK